MNPVKRFWQWLMRLGQVTHGESEFLCDTCRYHYGSACQRRERPNAITCPDYKRR